MPLEPAPSVWGITPPPEDADDLVALGADLEPGTVLAAYRVGLFPMPVEDAIGWWSPYRRGVLELVDLKVSRSLAQSARRYELRVDTAFDAVIAGCADPARDGGWIDADIIDAYRRLHQLGWAHSVETWHEGELVGGLYGLAIGGLFAGESMFSRQRDASKVALVGLVDLLRDGRERLIDTQWRTPHLSTLGVTEIDRAAYLARLPRLLSESLPACWG